jgi:diacylglycerol kinase (ATP)
VIDVDGRRFFQGQTSCVLAGNVARALARVALGGAAESPFIRVTTGTRFRIRFGRPVPCELDGGDRVPVSKLKITVHPGSITVCVPARYPGLSGS